MGIFLHDNSYLESNGVSLPEYMAALNIYIIILSLSLNYIFLFSFIFSDIQKNINERKYKGNNWLVSHCQHISFPGRDEMRVTDGYWTLTVVCYITSFISNEIKENSCFSFVYFIACKYSFLLYPGIYAEGYIVFVFLFIRLYGHSFVLPSITLVELRQSFMLRSLKWGKSHQPLIRKHSYLYHRYPGVSVFIPWLLTPGSMPQDGAWGQYLGDH